MGLIRARKLAIAWSNRDRGRGDETWGGSKHLQHPGVLWGETDAFPSA